MQALPGMTSGGTPTNAYPAGLGGINMLMNPDAMEQIRDMMAEARNFVRESLVSLELIGQGSGYCGYCIDLAFAILLYIYGLVVYFLLCFILAPELHLTPSMQFALGM